MNRVEGPETVTIRRASSRGRDRSRHLDDRELAPCFLDGISHTPGTGSSEATGSERSRDRRVGLDVRYA